MVENRKSFIFFLSILVFSLGFSVFKVEAMGIMKELDQALAKTKNVDDVIEESKEFMVLDDDGSPFSFYDKSKKDFCLLSLRQVNLKDEFDIKNMAKRLSNVCGSYFRKVIPSQPVERLENGDHIVLEPYMEPKIEPTQSLKRLEEAFLRIFR